MDASKPNSEHVWEYGYSDFHNKQQKSDDAVRCWTITADDVNRMVCESDYVSLVDTFPEFETKDIDDPKKPKSLDQAYADVLEASIDPFPDPMDTWGVAKAVFACGSESMRFFASVPIWILAFVLGCVASPFVTKDKQFNWKAVWLLGWIVYGCLLFFSLWMFVVF